MMNAFVIGIQRFLTLGGLVLPEGAQPAGGAAGEAVGEAAGYIQAVAPAADPGGMGMAPMLLIWGAVIVGFWFIAIRPQRKREKKLKEMQSSLKTGDNIVTSSGMFGRIADIGTDCFIVEMGIGGRTVKLPILKTDVLSVREPVMTPPPKEVSE